MYKIVVSYTAEKQLQNLSSVYYKRVINKLQQLQINPFDVSGTKKLQGTLSLYRIRVGDIRIIYDINTKTIIITIVEIIKRNDAYKKK